MLGGMNQHWLSNSLRFLEKDPSTSICEAKKRPLMFRCDFSLETCGVLIKAAMVQFFCRRGLVGLPQPYPNMKGWL